MERIQERLPKPKKLAPIALAIGFLGAACAPEQPYSLINYGTDSQTCIETESGHEVAMAKCQAQPVVEQDY